MLANLCRRKKECLTGFWVYLTYFLPESIRLQGKLWHVEEKIKKADLPVFFRPDCSSSEEWSIVEYSGHARELNFWYLSSFQDVR